GGSVGARGAGEGKGGCGGEGRRESGKRVAPPRGTGGVARAWSLDQLVGSHQHRWRNRQPETLGRPDIDYQIKPYGLFDRQFARFSSSQDLVHESRGPSPEFGTVWTIGH